MMPVTRSNSIAVVSDGTKLPVKPQGNSQAVSMFSDLDRLFDVVQELERDDDDESIDRKFDVDVDEDDDDSDFPSEEVRQDFIRTSIDASMVYQSQRKILVSEIFTVFRKMSAEEMTVVLSGTGDSKLKLLTCMHYVLSCSGESDDAANAGQLIADLAKKQNHTMVAEIFGNGPVNLAGIDLSGINFVGVDLCRANFNGANLSGAHFESSNLSGASFENSNLSGAKFINTNLHFVKFVESNLSCVSFKTVVFNGVEFIDANLNGADFNGENLNATEFHRSALCRANFRGVQIRLDNLKHCDLSWANFSGSNLEHSELHGSNLYLTNLNGTGLSREKLNGAIGEKSDMSDLRMENRNSFSNAYELALKRSLQSSSGLINSVESTSPTGVMPRSKSLIVNMSEKSSDPLPQTMAVRPYSILGWISSIKSGFWNFFRSVRLRIWPAHTTMRHQPLTATTHAVPPSHKSVAAAQPDKE